MQSLRTRGWTTQGTTPGDPKRIVTTGYDRCARAFAAARAGDSSAELALLTERLPAQARCLDVGCGAGEPVTAALARLGTVVGVDISAAQIQLARQNVPTAQLIHGDIMAQEFGDDAFDAVVAFYALFHLPRDEQRELLGRFARWVRPGGFVLATLPGSAHPGYTEPDFFGVTMYWSQHEASWYAARLVELGFEILHMEEVGHGYLDEANLPPERHSVVLGRLRESARAGP